MAQYKSAPSYEFIRGRVYVQFSPWGDFKTNDPVEISALDAVCAKSPFIKRVDVEPAQKATQVPEITEVVGGDDAQATPVAVDAKQDVVTAKQDAVAEPVKPAAKPKSGGNKRK